MLHYFAYYDLPVKLYTCPDSPQALPLCLVFSPRTGYFQERLDLYFEALHEHHLDEVTEAEFGALLAVYRPHFTRIPSQHELSPSRVKRLRSPLNPRAFWLGRERREGLYGVLYRARRTLAEARRVAQGRTQGLPRAVLAHWSARTQAETPRRRPPPRGETPQKPVAPSSPPSTRATPDSGLTPRFAGALDHAARLHLGQVRKGPFPSSVLGHLLSVSALTLEHGGSEDQAIAALLHDTLEDVSGTLAPEIEARFGAGVLEIVWACTDATAEDKGREAALEGEARLETWHARKAAHLAHLPSAPPDTFLVYLADKVHNTAALLEERSVEGEALWSRFTAGREGSLGYYRTLLGIFAAVASSQPPGFVRLLERYGAQVRALERI